MQSIFTVDEMAEYSRRQRSQGYTIALVPTLADINLLMTVVT